MPTYQYACTACDERLEAVQSFSDAALVECPACSGRLRKVFSAVGVVFKGSGFYKNDSRETVKKGSKSDSAASSSSSSTEGSGGSGDAGSSSTPKTPSTGSGGDSGSTGGGKSTPAAAPAATAPASSSGKSS